MPEQPTTTARPSEGTTTQVSAAPGSPWDGIPPPKPYIVRDDFHAKLDERGLPRNSTLDDLIQHERGQMGIQVACTFMAEMERAANRLAAAGDTHGAEAIRKATREGAPTDDDTE